MTNEAKKLEAELARGPRKREALVIWCMRQGIEKGTLDALLGELAGAGRLKIEGSSMAPTYRLLPGAKAVEEEPEVEVGHEAPPENASAEESEIDQEGTTERADPAGAWISSEDAARIIGCHVSRLSKKPALPIQRRRRDGRSWEYLQDAVLAYKAARDRLAASTGDEHLTDRSAPVPELPAEEPNNFIQDEDRAEEALEEPEDDAEQLDVEVDEEEEPIGGPEFLEGQPIDHAPTLLAAARRILVMPAHPVNGNDERVRALTALLLP